MTALPEEIDGAIAEGCRLLELKTPVRIESDENGNVIYTLQLVTEKINGTDYKYYGWVKTQ